MYIRGSLDVITPTGLAGWAYAPDARDGLTVQALLNHEVIGEAVADLHRPDLAEVGIGDGNCGYRIDFPAPLSPLLLPFVVVKPEGSDVEMPRAAISGYAEFFQAMFRDWPASGRHRSVLGGLWTDRLDAAALLRGRREIAMIAETIADQVETLIRSGLMMLPLARPSDETSPARAIERVLEAPGIIAALRAVLEDHPLVLRPTACEPTPFRQPSGMEALASPAECLALVLPLGGAAVELEVVRDSHLLPEFSADGASRWTSPTGHEALAMAEAHGMLDRYALAPDTLAVIGPGLLHRVMAPDGAAAIAVALPSRAAPLRRRLGTTHEIACASGARIWV
ncbi:MAG: hypothetical protein ABI224_03000 [Acetobacteraceae bacterium]